MSGAGQERCGRCGERAEVLVGVGRPGTAAYREVCLRCFKAVCRTIGQRVRQLRNLAARSGVRR